MKKYTYILLVFFMLTANTKAQDYLSFYNLKDYVIQVQDLSPVFLPKYSVSVGMPLNVGVNVNSDLKINDILVESTDGNLKVDLDNLNAVAGEENKVYTNTVVNVLMLGFKLRKGSLAFFVNTKTNLNWRFSKTFTDLAANGFGSSFSLSQELLRATSYNEIGVGFTQQFFKDKLALGVRVKWLNGIGHAEIQDNASFSAEINDLNWVFNSANATVNTSNVSNLSGDEFNLITQNTGLGIDLGVNYKLTDKLSFDVAINDLGSINWKDNVTNYTIADNNNVVYNGVDFEGSGDVLEEIETELGDVLGTSETNESFTTQLGSKIFAAVKYQFSERNALQAVYFNDNNPYIEIPPSFAIGYNRTHKKATYGLTAGSNGVSGDFRFGANLAVQLAFLQIYAAIDDFSNIGAKVEEVNNTNLRVGINFLFGYKQKVTFDEDIEDEDF